MSEPRDRPWTEAEQALSRSIVRTAEGIAGLALARAPGDFVRAAWRISSGAAFAAWSSWLVGIERKERS